MTVIAARDDVIKTTLDFNSRLPLLDSDDYAFLNEEKQSAHVVS